MSDVAPRNYKILTSMSEAAMLKHMADQALGWGKFLPSGVLRDAMAYLDQHGWCQGGIASKSGEVCGHGAILFAGMKVKYQLPWTITRYKNADNPFNFIGKLTLGGDPYYIEPFITPTEVVDNPERLHIENAMKRAGDALIHVAEKAGYKHEFEPAFKDAFAVFNDAPQTSIEDVVLMMKEAVAWLESQGE